MKIEFDLLSNAEDSIERAMELVAWGDHQPEPRRLKQAVQAVAHGVELLLKERLKRVHPCLIWENVDKYPSLSARTVTSEGAISRLVGIGGLEFDQADLELVRSLRSTRNAIEHFAWVTTKQEAEAIVGRALEFIFHFTRTELDYEFLSYRMRKDDTLHALLSSSQAFANSMAKRVFKPSGPSGMLPEVCNYCRARAVDPTTQACRLCGHWNLANDSDDDIPY